MSPGLSPAWRAALRIARRDAARARGRSVLVIAMIALPVLGLTMADVTARSAQLDPDEKVARTMGRFDAWVPIAYGSGTVLQSPDGMSSASVASGDSGSPAEPGAPTAYLPAGSKVVPLATAHVAVTAPGATLTAAAEAVDLTDERLTGMYSMRDGRAARSAGEVALSPRLAKLLRVDVGESVTINGASRTVVGLAERLAERRDSEWAFVPLGTSLKQSTPAGWLVDAPGAVSWDDVLALNARGFVAVSRSVLLDPPPRADVPFYDQQEGGGQPLDWVVPVLVIGLVVGLAMLEVVLLAGAAFAVGTRRQARSLGLVAAAGGDSRHVRRIVLASGLWLGLAGGAIGVLTGVVTSVATRGLLERWSGERLGRVDLRPLELLAIVAVGIVTGLLSAMLPARTAARQEVVRVLTGRRGDLRTPKRVPAVGLVLVVVGVLATLVASGRVVTARDELRGLESSETNLLIVALVGGAGLTVIGLVITSPAVIGAVSRLARWLPLAPRLALRDAARNRGRSAPAMAAVLAAVSGSVAVSLYVASMDDHDRRNHFYVAIPGQVLVGLESQDPNDPTRTTAVDPARVRTAVERAVPVRSAMTVERWRCSGGDDCHAALMLPLAQQCPLSALVDPPTAEQLAAGRTDPRCMEESGRSSAQGTIFGARYPVVTANQASAFTGRSTPQAAADVLARGGVIVADRRHVEDGRVTLEVQRVNTETGETIGTTKKSLPAVHVPSAEPSYFYPPLLSRGAVATLGGTAEADQVLFTLAAVPDDGEAARVRDVVSKVSASLPVDIERGYVSRYGLGLLALVLSSAVIALGAVGISTGLAQADARPDQATLAAVGASPRVRRVLAASQAGVLTLLGAVLGTAAGVVPALAVIRMQADMNLVVPWPALLATVVGLPLLALLLTGGLVRSRLPLQSRMV